MTDRKTRRQSSRLMDDHLKSSRSQPTKVSYRRKRPPVSITSSSTSSEEDEEEYLSSDENSPSNLKTKPTFKSPAKTKSPRTPHKVKSPGKNTHNLTPPKQRKLGSDENCSPPLTPSVLLKRLSLSGRQI